MIKKIHKYLLKKTNIMISIICLLIISLGSFLFIHFSLLDVIIGNIKETIADFHLADIVDTEPFMVKEILDNTYQNLTDSIAFNIVDESLDDLIVLSGEKKVAFELDGEKNFNDLEITFQVNTDIGENHDILALYIYQESDWLIQGYYEIIENKFIMETDSFGKYAIVNKSQGERVTQEILKESSKTPTNNLKKRLLTEGMYSSDEEVVISHIYTTTYADNLEFYNVTFKTDELGNMTFAPRSDENAISNFYFENCVFDGVIMKLQAKGHYTFNNCTFINSPEGTIELLGSGVNVYVYNSTLSDNQPDIDTWNGDGDERFYKYSAIGFRRSGGSAHIVNTTITRYMTHSTIYETTGVSNNKLYVEYSNISETDGTAIGLYSGIKGRIDNNYFYNIGGLRGKNGYEVTIHETLGGGGVGGNAIYCGDRTREMRVYKNNIKNVMENGIEGHYYLVNDNIIDTTGYRYDEGLTTVSTEAIWGGSWQIKNNIIRNVHGRGIMVNRWDDVQTEVSGNIIIKTGGLTAYDYEGIRISPVGGTSNVLVTNNVIEGFVHKYRVLNTEDKLLRNVLIEDKGYGNIIGEVYSALVGVRINTDRNQTLDIKNTQFLNATNGVIDDWNTKDVVYFEQKETSDGLKYGSFLAKKNRGEITQSFDLPKETVVVCLQTKLRSSHDTVKVIIRSRDDAGNYYPSNDGGSYAGYKIPLKSVESDNFQNYNVCFKAIDHTSIGLFADYDDQIVDVMEFNGYYFINDLKENIEEEIPSVSPSPEVSVTPEIVESPETTIIPEVSVSPSASVTPSVSPSPKVTAIAKATPKSSTKPNKSSTPSASTSPNPTNEEYNIIDYSDIDSSSTNPKEDSKIEASPINDDLEKNDVSKKNNQVIIFVTTIVIVLIGYGIFDVIKRKHKLLENNN